MLIDIVKDIVASHEDIEVAGEISCIDGLLPAIVQVGADVIVLAKGGADDTDDYREILHSRPQLKILTITADGRRGFLHEMAPRIVPLGEMSPASLIDAIRHASSSRVTGSAS